MRQFVMMAIAVLAATGPATAQTPIALDRFNQIELRGGGTVSLRQGPAQRVTLLRGDSAVTRFTVERNRLLIDACTRSCRGYNPEIEIVVPDIDAVAIQGGGSIRAREGFGTLRDVTLAVAGGGTMDMTAIDATSVTAAVQGGGAIRTRARTNLVAAVNGGGSITYWGDPEVVQSVSGGGSVRRGR